MDSTTNATTRRRFTPARSVLGRLSLSFQSFHHMSREEVDMIRIFTRIAAAGLFLGLLAGSTAPAMAQDDSAQELAGSN
jgi:hypothetical protein